MDNIIEINNISKKFGHLVAVDECSLAIEEGSITGLIGPNGAGKSTLFNLIAGAFPPDKGTIRLDGEDVTGLKAHRLFHQGIVRTFQIPHEFSHMSVIENLMVVPAKQLGENLLKAWFQPSFVYEQEVALRQKALEVLSFLNLSHIKNERAGNLSGGQKKLLELGRVMMSNPRVVLLDEIAAGVNRTLLREIADDILRLNRELGYTFFVIEHDMDLIARLCNPVIVMAGGRVMMHGAMDDIRRDERVIEAYFGAATV